MRHFYTLRCPASFWLIQCKPYQNRFIIAKVIDKSLGAHFFMAHCVDTTHVNTFGLTRGKQECRWFFSYRNDWLCCMLFVGGLRSVVVRVTLVLTEHSAWYTTMATSVFCVTCLFMVAKVKDTRRFPEQIKSTVESVNWQQLGIQLNTNTHSSHWLLGEMLHQWHILAGRMNTEKFQHQPVEMRQNAATLQSPTKPSFSPQTTQIRPRTGPTVDQTTAALHVDENDGNHH